MFCNKTKLFTRKNTPKVSLLQIFLLVQTPVKLRNSQIYKNFQLWYNLNYSNFFSSFCPYLWETDDLKNISKVHGSSYFYRAGGKHQRKICIVIYIVLWCITTKTVNKIWWYWLLFPNYVFKQDKMFYIKGNAKYFYCCYLTFLVLFVLLSFHFSMFFLIKD